MPSHSSVPPSIPGFKVDRPGTDFLRGEVAKLLDLNNTRFPGAQPVSFAREHLTELQRKEYFMCEKTDGIRCLLFLFFSETPHGYAPVTILIDRKNDYYDVRPPLRFPHWSFPLDQDKFLFNTILDGELVHDRVPGQPNPRLIFYVFDCLVIDSQNFTARPLDKRLGYMKDKIFNHYNRFYRQHPDKFRNDPFRVKEKVNYPSYHLANIFNSVLPTLPHGNDGLVFTCKGTPYKFGTDEHILKWKPPHENTIDFKLRLGEFPTYDPQDGEPGEVVDYYAKPEPFQLLVMYGKDHYEPFEHNLYITDEEWETLMSLNQRLDGRIIECYRDDQGRWRFKKEDDGTPRWRDDKKDANHISTVRSVLESIEDPVTKEQLLHLEPKIREAVHAIRAREKEELVRREQMEREAKKRKLAEVTDG